MLQPLDCDVHQDLKVKSGRYLALRRLNFSEVAAKIAVAYINLSSVN
jgi:hypothetical protein